jgi:hypothetical protein
LSLLTEFHAKCGNLPINMSIIFAACTIEKGSYRSLHSHYQIRQGLSRRTITMFESSPTPDGDPGPQAQISYQAVIRKLLELNHLLGGGQQNDVSRQPLQWENEAADPGYVQRYVHTNHAPNSTFDDFLPIDPLQITHQPAKAGAEYEPVQIVFQTCGLLQEPGGLKGNDTFDPIGKFIFSFFCYLHGGPQIFQALCRQSILRQDLRHSACASATYSVDACT